MFWGSTPPDPPRLCVCLCTHNNRLTLCLTKLLGTATPLKGHLCSECVDGFGPSVTSFGYRCVNCTDVWYRVLLFLFIKFVPITVLYLIIFYISIIRPHLEYAAPVWSPEHMKDINKLENVQKFALRVCTKQWNSPYEDLIDMCHLPELRTRRNHLSLGLLHKIINEECILPNAPLHLTLLLTLHTLMQVAHLLYRMRALMCFTTRSSTALSLYGMLSLLMYQLSLPFSLSNINYCIFVNKL